MRTTIIAGARPNFMKIAPLIEAMSAYGSEIQYRLIHTGQHYDKKMSQDFFDQLEIPEPDVNLQAGGGSQAEQTANIMVKFEQELVKNPADLVIVVGDVTSTMACAIVAKKLNTRVAHIEAGIRSGDINMPEEINRIVTDSIADYFFTTSPMANHNLTKTGVPKENIFFVGNTMIDTLMKHMPFFKRPLIWSNAKLTQRHYIVLTLHRPTNVDCASHLQEILSEITNSYSKPIIFPTHPRTLQVVKRLQFSYPNLYLIDPLSYLEFNYLVKHSEGVITDSGGITEETTVMGVPCMTLRDNTERPETCTEGTNVLVGTDPRRIGPSLLKLQSGSWKKGRAPEFWDGKTAKRIVHVLLSLNLGLYKINN